MQFGETRYLIDLTGSVGAAGGALTGATGHWSRFTIVAANPTPTPTPPPGPTPTPLPVGTPYPRPPLYIYSGSYSVLSATAPTVGCFALETTTDGSPIFPGHSTISAIGAGSPNYPYPPPGFVSVFTNRTNGQLTNITLSVSATGTGSFTLDNGDTGTLWLTSRAGPI